MKIIRIPALFLLLIAAALPSCKIPSDKTRPAYDNIKTVKLVLSEDNGGNTDSAIAVQQISNEDGITRLRLRVASPVPLKELYLMKSQDNGDFFPVAVLKQTNSYGIFDAGSTGTYSLAIPELKNFEIEIPVLVRASSLATTDVYKIWLTDSTGSFSKPAKETQLGIATVTLRYQSDIEPTFSTSAALTLNSPSAASNTGFLSTSAKIGVLDSTGYSDSPASVDLRLITMRNGKRDDASENVFLYSPADLAQIIPETGSSAFSVPTGSRTSFIALYSDTTTAYNNVTGTFLQNLSVGTNKGIEIKAGKLYMFQTEAGKKGIIKVNATGRNASAASGKESARFAAIEVKVLN